MPQGRPSCESWVNIINTLHRIGYIFHQDGFDGEYYIQVFKSIKQTKNEQSAETGPEKNGSLSNRVKPQRRYNAGRASVNGIRVGRRSRNDGRRGTGQAG